MNLQKMKDVSFVKSLSSKMGEIEEFKFSL